MMRNLARALTMLLAAAAFAAAPAWAAKPKAKPQDSIEGPDLVVYHVNDAANATAALRNINNHLEVNPKAKIVVVTHALGVDFLMHDAKDKNGNPYNIPVEELTARGVVFDVCEITLKNRKLERSQFISEAKFVPSGVAEIAKLQARKGYAYIKP